MAAMNATGGPVGGGMMMLNNNGSPAMPGGMNAAEASRQNLNTYIYDYLLKHGHYDIARSIIADGSFEFNKAPAKTSPGRRKDGGEMNGDADGMDMDQKDDVPDDLPRPRGWEGSQGNCFLLEWFNIFFDIFQAHTSKKGSNPAAAAYLNNEKQAQRQREMTQNQNLMRQGMNPALMRNMNGMPNGNMPKLNPQQMQQMQQIQAKRAQMAQQQQQLNRGEQPDAEMNGVRPGTPGDGDAGGSPSKRARIDNGQQNFNNGMIQNGRPAAGPGAQNQMLMQSGFNPPINQQFRQNGGMPPKAMQGAMPNGAMMNMGNAGSPMMQGMNQYPEGMQMEFMQQRNMQGGQPGMAAGGGGQSGNHALQDYQMQLMLLEQQNKKRLMMARQEQHENNPGAGGPMPGVNMQATGMSPGGSRTGASPNPEAMAGRSPGPMNFMNNMQGGEFHPQQMFMGDKGQMQMGPGPQGMRPPTSNAMGQPGARPGPFQGGQPMQQQGSQAGQQIGTPGQREMPPPQAPAGGSAQRNQGASPSGGNAPPTPSQTHKAGPKGTKKAAANKDDAKRQRPAKKGAAANAGASDENPPATPTPSTPITPNNPGVMNAANKGQPGMQGQNQHPQNPGMQMSQPVQQNDMQFSYGDTGNGGENQPFNLDFTSLENADVLENFDFDSFLNTSADDAFNVDIGGDFSTDFMGQTD